MFHAAASVGCEVLGEQESGQMCNLCDGADAATEHKCVPSLYFGVSFCSSLSLIHQRGAF